MKKILSILIMGITLFSCSNKKANEKVLVFNAIAEGQSFDPQLLTDGNTMTVHSLLSEGLTYIKADGSVVPAAAKSWEVSEDGLTWTFHLRDDLKWSNGEKITAHDFAYGWSRALSKELASDYAYMLFVIKNAEKYTQGLVELEEVGIKVIDDLTLEVKLENITPYFDSLVSFITYMPANKEFVESKGSQYALEAEDFIYSGPFKAVKWDHNVQIEMVRNEHYHSPQDYNVDKVIGKYIADLSASVNAFKNDEIHVTSMNTEQYLEFKDDSRVKVDGLARTNYLTFNLDNPTMQNLNLRKAIGYAIDKDDLVQVVFSGLKNPSHTFTPKNVGINGLNGDFSTELGDVFEGYNPQKAKEYFQLALKELGLTKLPKLKFLADERGSNRKVVEAIQEYLRVNLEMEVEVEIVTFKERLSRTRSRQFDILLTGWGADYQDPMTFLDLLMSRSGNNSAHYNSSQYDELVTKAMKSNKKDERINYLFEAERLLAKEVPIVPLYQETQVHIVNEKVKGIEFSSFGSLIKFKGVDILE